MADLMWAKQRKVLRAANTGFNAEVYNHFKGEDLTEGRINVRDLCLIGAKDSRITADSKMRFFYERVLKVQHKPAVIGEFKTTTDEKVKYKCQVQLYFKQDIETVADGYSPLDAQISFRIDETSTSITKAKYTAIANKIKTEFSSSNGYRWTKGKYLCLYDDPENGYHFQIYAQSAAEGEEVIKKVLRIQTHTFESDKFRVTEPKRSSENTTSSETILGQSKKKPRWRPTAAVRFKWADLVIHNLQEPICLVDMTATRYNPIVKGWL